MRSLAAQSLASFAALRSSMTIPISPSMTFSAFPPAVDKQNLHIKDIGQTVDKRSPARTGRPVYQKIHRKIDLFLQHAAHMAEFFPGNAKRLQRQQFPVERTGEKRITAR